MIVHTVLRDCVYLNWAIPADLLPPAPPPLRYEVHSAEGLNYVFASALLFHQDRLRLARVPAIRFSYPQFNLRLYVLDRDGIPAVFFVRLMVPRWVVPGARWLAGQPVVGASFDFAQPSRSVEAETWRWSVRRGSRLSITGSVGAGVDLHRVADVKQGHSDTSFDSVEGVDAPTSRGPSLGPLESKIKYFSHRDRGYSMTKTGLTLIEARHRISAVWPLRVDLARSDLITSNLGLTDDRQLPPLHSAWLCPEIPFSFELNSEPGKSKLAPTRTSVAADPAMSESGPVSLDPSIAA